MQTTLYSSKYNFKVSKGIRDLPQWPTSIVYNDAVKSSQDGVPRTVYVGSEAAVKRDFTPNPFDRLPIEMNQRIAEELESDDDLYSFIMTCRSARNAVDGDQLSFWRRRFLEVFDAPGEQLKNSDLKKDFTKRKRVLKYGASFKLGHTKEEERCLEVLRDIICEAHSVKVGNVEMASKNIYQVMFQFVQNHDLLRNIFNPKNARAARRWGDCYPQPASPLLQAVQVLLMPCMLDPSFDPMVYRFPDSQQVAYASRGQVRGRPIFRGTEIDMDWLLHQANFWKYHMMNEAEHLFPSYEALEDCDRPRFWTDQLKDCQEMEIGEHWKGSYAFVKREAIEFIRSGRNSDEQVQDEFGGEADGEFQDIKLSFDPQGRREEWPELFERELKSREEPLQTGPTTRAQTRRSHSRSSSRGEVSDWEAGSRRFSGAGSDVEERFLADGWFNPLPKQQGIPGFKRMTMMKYFVEDESGALDMNSLWAYEGVVLPGSKIILGRWWSIDYLDDEHCYSGPFILWNVHRPKAAAQEREASEEL